MVTISNIAFVINIIKLLISQRGERMKILCRLHHNMAHNKNEFILSLSNELISRQKIVNLNSKMSGEFFSVAIFSSWLLIGSTNKFSE